MIEGGRPRDLNHETADRTQRNPLTASSERSSTLAGMGQAAPIADFRNLGAYSSKEQSDVSAAPTRLLGQTDNSSHYRTALDISRTDQVAAMHMGDGAIHQPVEPNDHHAERRDIVADPVAHDSVHGNVQNEPIKAETGDVQQEFSSEVADTKEPTADPQTSPVTFMSGPSEDVSTEEWKDVIKTYFPEFSGDDERAAELLHSFHQGKRGVQELIEGTDIELPKFGIARDELVAEQNVGDMQSNFNHETGEQSVTIRRGALENYTKGDYHYTALLGKNDEVIHRGSIPDYLQLSGFEEYHHAVFMQLHDIDPNDPNHHSALAGDLSPSEYHALTMEYYALVDQIKYAEKIGMPEITITTMRDLAEQSKAIREERGLPTDGIDFKALYQQRKRQG